MGVAEVRRLKPLEEENNKLRQLVADLSLAVNPTYRGIEDMNRSAEP
jgi:hypothetical protein